MYNKVNSIIYIGKNKQFYQKNGLKKIFLRELIQFEDVFDAIINLLQRDDLPDVIFFDEPDNSTNGSRLFKMIDFFKMINKKEKYNNIVFVLINNSSSLSINEKRKILNRGVDEIVTPSFSFLAILPRLNFLIEYKKILKKKKVGKKATPLFKLDKIKRAFDIITALTALILVSPILVLTALAIKIESKGPVFYSSKRVGNGYKVFNFYKLRSMRINADQELNSIKNLNQYKGNTAEEIPKECELCLSLNHNCSTLLFFDGKSICENHYLRIKKADKKGTFVKISNDPRITFVGRFIRNTSIDELPQLINVLKGDMSIVGNRPLPLYEAEQLTTDEYALRFLAPCGITGLWQVEKRGGNKMSEDERKSLDNVYAKKHNFWYDIKLILRTVPALIQSEDV